MSQSDFRNPIRKTLFCLSACSLLIASAAHAKTKMVFAAIRAGEIVGRVDFAMARAEGNVFLVTAFYKGKEALAAQKKKAKPWKRSYAELVEPGYLGKYKRWEPVGRAEHYWMLFLYGDRVRVRHEKGEGGKVEVKEVGRGHKVIPLDNAQPHLAWLVVSLTKNETVTCANPVSLVLGTARVHASGQEEVRLSDGKALMAWRYDVRGDCGNFSVWLDQNEKPVAMESDSERWERISSEEAK